MYWRSRLGEDGVDLSTRLVEHGHRLGYLLRTAGAPDLTDRLCEVNPRLGQRTLSTAVLSVLRFPRSGLLAGRLGLLLALVSERVGLSTVGLLGADQSLVGQ